MLQRSRIARAGGVYGGLAGGSAYPQLPFVPSLPLAPLALGTDLYPVVPAVMLRPVVGVHPPDM